MTDERDPVRWRDAGSDCDPMLRRLLDGAHRGLSGAQADALAQRIEQAVRTRVIVAAQPSSSLWSTKWIAGVGIAGIAALWLAVNAWSTQPSVASNLGQAPLADASSPSAAVSSVRPAARAPIAMQANGGGSPEVAQTIGQQEDEQPIERVELSSGKQASRRTDTTAREHAQEPARATSPQEPSEVGVPEQTAVPPELQLLTAAQSALRGSPAIALELANEHAEAYPAGRFAQEREEIAIEALFALGRLGEGTDRARAFLARYPRSVQAARIAKRLAGGSD